MFDRGARGEAKAERQRERNCCSLYADSRVNIEEPPKQLTAAEGKIVSALLIFCACAYDQSAHTVHKTSSYQSLGK